MPRQSAASKRLKVIFAARRTEAVFTPYAPVVQTPAARETSNQLILRAISGDAAVFAMNTLKQCASQNGSPVQ